MTKVGKEDQGGIFNLLDSFKDERTDPILKIPKDTNVSLKAPHQKLKHRIFLKELMIPICPLLFDKRLAIYVSIFGFETDVENIKIAIF